MRMFSNNPDDFPIQYMDRSPALVGSPSRTNPPAPPTSERFFDFAEDIVSENEHCPSILAW